MGNFCCGPNDHQKNSREIVLACFGIDGAGKTSSLKILRGESPQNVLSTNGFSLMEMTFDDEFKIKIYDLGGNERIRDIWQNYYAEIHGFIYVLDASKSTRINENIRVMQKLLSEPDIRGKPCLIVLNRFNSLDFDEYTFTNEVGLQQISHTFHQHFYVTHLDEYDGFLDKVKNGFKPVMTRFNVKKPHPLLEGFVLMVRQIIQDYVRLNAKVLEAEALLKQRQEQERLRRRIRLAELERNAEEGREEVEEMERPATTMTEMERRNDIVETVYPNPSEPRTPKTPDSEERFPLARMRSDEIATDEEPLPGPSSGIPMGAASIEHSIDGEQNALEMSELSSVFREEPVKDEILRSGSRSSKAGNHWKGSTTKANSVSSGGPSSASPILNGVEMVGPSQHRLPPLRREQSTSSFSHIGPESDETFKKGARPASRKKSRMARIQSGLAKKRPIVHSAKNGPSNSFTLADEDTVSAKGIRNAAFEDEDIVSAKKLGSNTSLKSFAPNGSLSNDAVSITYRKDGDIVEVTNRRHVTTTADYFDSKIPRRDHLENQVST
ncbi:unnamed protein product, partial [Mesorhabditis belari]|uniref:ADP-ribosylation factor-like protein 13B n=1 Tax=Mesorhabditis belari TaxID=2138241 RepID=A0AAF3EDH2_9BILA